jgi:hypothetical protein
LIFVLSIKPYSFFKEFIYVYSMINIINQAVNSIVLLNA